jgi:hypothetical protein
MVQNQDRIGLAKFIEWEGGFDPFTPTAYFKGAPNVEGRSVGVPHLYSGLIREDDIHLAAMFQLMFMVNKGLYPGVRLELAYNFSAGKSKLRQFPIDLLMCLWLQLAQTISENKKHRQCPGCGKWFEIGGKGSRTDKKYCGDACRMRINRECQEARAMARTEKAKKKKGK